MKEKLKDTAWELLLGGIQKKVTALKDNYEWKKLFIDSGIFLNENPDTLKSFGNDLYHVFSKDNMERLSRKLHDERGYDFPQLLHNELYDLMIRYEISESEAETYIHHFTQMIISYLENGDSCKTLEMYLGEWRKEEQKDFATLISNLRLIIDKIDGLKESEILSYSIVDIDTQIRKESLYKGMSLNFFEIDDEQFESAFLEKINNERIFIVGKSREETVYRVLNLLRNKYSERDTLIIKNESEWKKLEKEHLSGNILIPFFLAESIAAIPNNTNIFIYGEDEPCYDEYKLILRKRTRQNLIRSLEKIGIDVSEAHKMVDHTHGLHVPLKKRLFNGAIHQRPKWVEEHSDTAMAALLCGKWTKSDGDTLIFEEISGKKYSDYKKELESYEKGDNPFIVTIQGRSGSNMQLASIEDAWEELDTYISDEMWNNFIELFYEVLIESEPIFEYPFEKHFEASIYAEKPEWSPALKQGMIRTLVMRAYYRKHDEYQNQIDHVVERVLETITTKERWGYISQYITDLCEASPKAVMQKLEDEFTSPTGLVELFQADDGDFITGRHYYINVLWAVEQLLQQKIYVHRAVEWLWKMNSFQIKYSMSNSPENVLGVVFCAELNMSALSVEGKINLAERAVKSHLNAWDVIFSRLPDGMGGVCFTLNTPGYRRVDEPDVLYVEEIRKTYEQYLHICVNFINGSADRWKKIIGCLHRYDENIQNDVLEKLKVDCSSMPDQKKIQIKNEIRHLIYHHRYFSNAAWSMEENVFKKYETIMNEIIMQDKVYDYLYLFSPIYEFPLLQPVPFEREEGADKSANKNFLLRAKEIEIQMKDFKENEYSLERLIELAVEENMRVLGDVLAEFYCESIYDENVLKILLKKDKTGKHIYEYIRFFVLKDSVKLNDILDKVKMLSDNENLIVDLIGLDKVDNVERAIIMDESDSIKSAYWSRDPLFRISEKADESVYLWALNECHKYGTLESYLKLLFYSREKLKKIQIYEFIFEIENMKSDASDNMTYYYLEKLLETLQDSFMDDLEKCSRIAALEWQCRNMLEWEQMKCVQAIMKSDPCMYAYLVQIIYKSDEDSGIVNEEKRDLANKVYSGFSKAKFCPAEKEGKVDYRLLKEWVDKFKELLVLQKQEKMFEDLLGRLLAHAPAGEDGRMPCEEVRAIIEEYYSESFKESYVCEEKNKRGIHTVDAGKSEMEIYQRYRENAEALQSKYPCTAEIYFSLSNSYKWQANWERRRAEDEW